MIIKPMETEPEFHGYFRERFEYASGYITGLLANNLVRDGRKLEIDAYDLRSFHYGAFEHGEFYACTRVVSDTMGAEKLIRS